MQTIRYLCRAKLSEGQHAAELTTDRREYHPGEPVRLRVRFADERLAPAEDNGVTVVVEQPGHKTQRVQLHRAEAGRGIFEGVLSKAPVGSYHAWIAVPGVEGRAPAVDFTVAPPPGEFAASAWTRPRCSRRPRRRKGRFYTFADAERLLADLPPGRQVPIETLPPMPLWNTTGPLLFLGLLIGEWILRKRGGMA